MDHILERAKPPIRFFEYVNEQGTGHILSSKRSGLCHIVEVSTEARHAKGAYGLVNLGEERFYLFF